MIITSNDTGPSGLVPAATQYKYGVTSTTNYTIEDYAGNSGTCTANIHTYLEYSYQTITERCLKYGPSCSSAKYDFNGKCENIVVCPPSEIATGSVWETPIYKTETEAKSVCENEVLNNCKCSKGSIFAFEGPCPSKVISKMCTGPQTCLGGYVYDYGEWSYWSTMWCVPSSTLNCQLRTNYY